MTNWVTLNYSDLNAVGTNQKFYIENGGLYHDVTPQTTIHTGLTNPFASSSGSKLITVTDTAHGASVGTWVTLTSTTAIGTSTTTATGSSSAFTITVASATNIYAGQGVSGTGIGALATVVSVVGTTVTLSVANSGAVSGSMTFTVSISGAYEIVSVADGNTYSIIGAIQASSTTTGGGTVTAHYDIAAGSAVYSTGNGWGAGTWSGITSATLVTTLSGTITSATNPINVVSTIGFGATGTIGIDSEAITYTGTTATQFTGCTRGATYPLATSPSTAAAHSSGANVYQGATGWGEAAPLANSIGTQLRLWSADTFGQDLIFAPRGGAIYYWAVDTSAYPRAVTLTSLGGSYVPTTTLAVIASDVQRFVIAFGSNRYEPGTPGTTFDPMLVRWSDQENAYDWVPSATNQSGEYKLAGGSTIVAARTAKQEVLIWTDAALFTMQYLGPPYVWGFNLLMDNTSIISPNAIASVNNQTFWMGTDKFYVYTGRVDTLNCTVWQYVFNDINLNQKYQIVSGTNEKYSEVWWFYPSANSPVNDRYVIYNHMEKIWYYGTMNRTAWLDSPLRDFPMGAQSVQNSFLSAALTTTPTTNATLTLLNGYSYPNSGTLLIDSECISYTAHDINDGNTLTGCTRGVFNLAAGAATTVATHVQYSAVTYLTPNQVMFHENGTDDCSLVAKGEAIYSYVQSSDFDIGDGHNFGFVWRMLPDVTFDGSNVPAPKVNLSVLPRQNSGSRYGAPNTPAVTSVNNYSPLIHNYVIQRFTGQVYTRIRGRQMAFKIESTDKGVAWQLGATRIDVRPDGRR